jgi:hypothetical protein
LPVEILLPTGKTRTLIKPTSKATVKRVPLAERPTDVRFDPDETILKEVVAAATP